MANASITISACDNELYLVAVNSAATQSYQLAHIQSGGGNLVGVSATVAVGIYSEPATLYGITGRLSASYSVYLPAGTYNLVPIGINWAGSQQFVFTLNGTPFSEPFSNPGSTRPTVVWNPTAGSPMPPAISFTIS
jgi:hypothetical protein